MSETTNETTNETVLDAAKDRVSESIARLWWVGLLRGVLLVVLGGYALSQPGMTLLALTQVLGIFAIADGILALIAGILGWTGSRTWTILRGILAIIVGSFVLGHSVIVAGITAIIVMIIVGIQAVASGVLEIMVAIRLRKEIEGEGWMILSGVLTIAFGVILMLAPIASSLVLVRILGVFAIGFGIAVIFTAFRIKSFAKQLAE